MSDITDQPGKSRQWIRRANLVMAAVVSILGGYVAVKYFTMSAEEGPAAAGNDFRETASAAGPAPGVQAPPLSVYLAGIAQRNLFETPDPPAAAENTALPAALPDLESKIKLIGILVDRDSKAIVEDLQGRQTHFLSRGDSIGAVLVEEIREDKVIFMYQNERFEMSL